MEVGADHDQARPEGLDEHLVHEILGALTGACLVEWNDDRTVDSGLCQQFELLVEVGQQRGTDPGRITVAGCRSKVTTTLCSACASARDGGGGWKNTVPRCTPS